MRLVVLICLFSFALVGCSTLSSFQPDETPVADTETTRLAARLSSELDRRSRHDPAALDVATPEMQALEAAFFPPEQAVAVQAEPEEVVLNVEMDGARSLFHAIHIASYRNEATARAGWQTLAAMFPDVLGGAEPRLEAVDIPEQGRYLRLKAGPFNSHSEAQAACAPFRSANAWCAPVDFTGEALDLQAQE